ncbi:Polymyxin resistance protein PmrJ, predicted deacetylase [Salinisphaera sp. LB1]|nr:4-deoxy-4-formamido-L-arabinose-phosphoundecaprenol deformylase [Salinisphaera sp. LB1]AWN15248.1 Polymyxin resistance protein PmrJ, predicted deacetylase [Salinisphaera sp. LB1]
MIDAGLRIDVDTFRGTRDGVPQLLRTLDKHHLRATFFFSVGPDNMGRHVWRLFKPAFLRKMLRSDAAALYGWPILLAGTAWPGRRIGRGLADVIRSADRAGHEIGLHAWDHHGWQVNVDRRPARWLDQEIERGTRALAEILGRDVDCSATAGWRTTPAVIEAKQRFGFRYNSDCRGHSIFRPRLADHSLGAPQIPVDLPTYDERAGGDVDAAAFNDLVLDRIRPNRLNVYTVHAEVEGGVLADAFDRLLARAHERGIRFRPLGELLPTDIERIPPGRITAGPIEGREGWLAQQAPEDANNDAAE